jgi:UDPglucose 6-dehydrogenase
MPPMRIAVVGTGYVGLVTGACFADSGNQVTCVDRDAHKLGLLRRGEVPFYEPGLAELVKANRAAGRLDFTEDLPAAAREAEVVFIAVGTPPGQGGEADVSAVLEVARGLAPWLRPGALVVTKSTVPVGTTARVRQELAGLTQVPFEVASNPEFLKEGAALEDFQRPDRVVIGADADSARRLLGELYAPFVRTEKPILFMDPRSAELTKYAANAFLATRISFINDIALLCERLGADVDQVRKGMGADRRIGYPFLFPGVGYGGSCFPKDVQALLATARAHQVDFELLQAVERTNERQKRALVDKAQAHFGGTLEGRAFAVWGLAFKPRTDDVREAPALALIEELLARGATVRCYDPVAQDNARQVLGERVRHADSPYHALEGADGLFLVTEWNEFRHPDLQRMKALLRTPLIFDGRNLLNPQTLRAQGFTYYGIGRPGPVGEG